MCREGSRTATPCLCSRSVVWCHRFGGLTARAYPATRHLRESQGCQSLAERKRCRATSPPGDAGEHDGRNEPGQTTTSCHRDSTAIGRCPAPLALANNAAPITVTASARRSNTLAGNSTCVRPQPRHRPRRGSNRPAPRTRRSRADPHGPSTPPQPSTGQSNRPERRSFSTAAPSSPTVITRCTPMHQDGPSVSSKTSGRAVAPSGHPHPDVAHDPQQEPDRPTLRPTPRSAHVDAVILRQRGGQHLVDSRARGPLSRYTFEPWGRSLPEHTTAVSMLDRLLHHCHTFVTDGATATG